MKRPKISNEEYQRQPRHTPETTLKVMQTLFGHDWKKRARAEFDDADAFDFHRWEALGAPLSVIDRARHLLVERKAQIDEALLEIAPPERH